jgi:drug/metabolite transporter (DMT)-like permease
MQEASAVSIAKQKKKELDSSFFKKGIMVALFSSLMYGFYTAFVTAGQNSQLWTSWTSAINPTAFLAVFIIPTVASAINDSCSAIWALAITAKQGKLGDFGRTINTKPGVILMLSALVGGPIATVAYIIALSQAGTIVVPIAALNPAIGSILSRVLYKQELGPRKIAGIAICVLAGLMIGTASLTGDSSSNMVLGLALAFIAALGWGAEGCIAGYASCMIDTQIGITIRQCVSGVVELIVILPVLSLIGGVNLGQTFGYVGAAITDLPTILCFIVAGFSAYKSFASWYRGNSMCGTALGMACNGTYTFVAPLVTWIIVGLIMGVPGYALPPIAWVAAVVMILGILVIAVDPKELFGKKEEA